MVFEYRMARQVYWASFFVVFEILRAQRNSLIQHHMAADNSRFADDYTRTMVNAEMVTYLCGRVNIDARTRVRQFR